MTEDSARGRTGFRSRIPSRLGGALMWTAPLAIALFSPLTLLVFNLGEIPPSAAVRSIATSLALGLAFVLVMKRLVRPRERAVVLASAAMFAFFTYGHLYDGMKRLGPAWIPLARHRILVPLEALLFVVVMVIVIRRPTFARPIAQWLTATAWILLALATLDMVRQLAPGWIPSGEDPRASLATSGSVRADLPDVFYIVLDGYGRSDVLEASYGYDNGPFLDSLRGRGFYIADRSMSNYSRTLLSLSSSLNMDYLDQLLGPGVLGRDVRQPFIEAVASNRVFSLFRDLGYSIVAFETGYHPTELHNADVYLVPDHGEVEMDQTTYAGVGLNEFEGLFLQTTMATAAFDWLERELQRQAPELIRYEYNMHRTRILFALSSLSDVAAHPGPQFVFAHILAPHPPFVFGPGGENIPQQAVFSFAGDGCCQGNDYVERYIGQVRFLNQALESELGEVLEAADGNAIIILQGDHGPAGYLHWDNPGEAEVYDRMAILNAYYLPDSPNGVLYPTISPVNTFRAIFDQFYGGEFGLLEDVSYFTSSLRLSDATVVAPIAAP